MDAQQVWTECSETLRSQVSEATWKTWFESIHPLAVTNGAVVLGLPNVLVRERLEGRYRPLLEDALREIVGVGVPLRFVIDEDVAAEEEEEDAGAWPEIGLGHGVPGAVGGGFGGPNGIERSASGLSHSPVQAFTVRPPTIAYPERGQAREDGRTSASRADEQLNSRYTFDGFVSGPSNRFAYAAALAVAERPGCSYNPLFIYGDAGLGKTHLLHAIGNYVCENFPAHHVRYVSTETFMNEFVEAIRSRDRDLTGFKRRYRACDVLLVDDVQFMENKEQLQEEFFHTFNSLHEASKQLVLTSDRQPKAIATLEDRLRSRFLSGLITEVQPPELETRLAILRAKAEHERVVVDDEILEFIATNVKDNIRELEGALIRITAFANLNGRTLTRDLAESVLADIVASHQPRQITAQQILEATSKMFGFGLDEICGHSRRRPLVIARQVSMYVFRELTDFSYPAIAREFGGRDHTTVIHAVEKISGLMGSQREIYDKVTQLILSIKNGG